MNDFARLIVGIILLGLAILLSLNLGEPEKNAASNEETQEPASDSPDWQATQPKPDQFTRRLHESGNDVVRPDFGGSADRPAENTVRLLQDLPSQQRPPQIGDSYRPAERLNVTGQLQPESDLVPVQPRPSFTGKISYVKKIHTIRHGDTLQSIAREYYGTAERYLDIYLLNKDVLSNPGRLPEGVEIRIPEYK